MSVGALKETVLSRSTMWQRWEFDVPFLGALNVTWNGMTHGRSWFDTETAEPGVVEVWAGRLHVLACRDTGIRPDKRTVAIAAFVVAEVVRWFW